METTKDEVFSKVQGALVDALGVDEDEVTPEARLVGDLGAESIDFLDIVFRLEKAFDIKIPRGELFPEDILTNAQYVQNGRVTPEGLEQLKTRMAFADLTAFSANPVVQDFGNLLTVRRHVPVCGDQGRSVRCGPAAGVGRTGVGRNRRPVVAGILPGQSPRARQTGAWGRIMRWFWIDRFLEFESGRHAVAVKNVSLAEEHLHDHFPGAPLMPNSLIIEGIAQTGGLLVAEHGGFEERVVLAKVAKAAFHLPAVPGDTLTYRATIDDIHKDGAIVSGTSHVGERLQAEVQVFFAHLGEEAAGKSLFDPANLLAMLRLLRVFDVGREPTAARCRCPPACWLPNNRPLPVKVSLNKVQSMRRRVVITGVGCVTPMGTEVERVWQGLKEGASGVGYTSIFDASRFPTKISAEVRDWDVSRSGRGRRGLGATRPPHQFAAGAAKKAVRDSGIFDAPLDPARFGVYLGSGEGQQYFSCFTQMMTSRSEGRQVRPGAVHQGRPGMVAPDDRTGTRAQHAGRPPGRPVQCPGAECQLPDGLRRQQPGHRRGDRDRSAAARPT